MTELGRDFRDDLGRHRGGVIEAQVVIDLNWLREVAVAILAAGAVHSLTAELPVLAEHAAQSAILTADAAKPAQAGRGCAAANSCGSLSAAEGGTGSNSGQACSAPCSACAATATAGRGAETVAACRNRDARAHRPRAKRSIDLGARHAKTDVAPRGTHTADGPAVAKSGAAVDSRTKSAGDTSPATGPASATEPATAAGPAPASPPRAAAKALSFGSRGAQQPPGQSESDNQIAKSSHGKMIRFFGECGKGMRGVHQFSSIGCIRCESVPTLSELPLLFTSPPRLSRFARNDQSSSAGTGAAS